MTEVGAPKRVARMFRPVRWQLVVLIGGLVAISLNQRPALVAVGILTAQLRSDTGIGATAASLLTTLPLLCFGVFALLAPALGRRIGLDRTLFVALSVLLAGVVLRVIPSLAALFIGSAIAGAGIAISNVLLPGVIKRDFANHIGLAVGIYTLLLSGGAALASAVTIPMGEFLGTNWRTTLALWGLLAILALGLWAPWVVCQTAVERNDVQGPIGVWRSRLAWAVAGFMALQSWVYFALIAWLPTILKDAGLSQSRAGFMSAVMSTVGIAASFVSPVLAPKMKNQRPLVFVTAATFAAGITGLLCAPASGVWAWMVLIGIGQGAGIGLALTLFVLRSRNSAVAAQLSGMAQTAGYLVAATGPLIIGVLHDLSGSWTISLATLIAVLVGLVLTGWYAAASRAVEDDLQDGPKRWSGQ